MLKLVRLVGVPPFLGQRGDTGHIKGALQG